MFTTKEENAVATMCAGHIFIPGGTLAGRGIISKYEVSDISSLVILEIKDLFFFFFKYKAI